MNDICCSMCCLCKTSCYSAMVIYIIMSSSFYTASLCPFLSKSSFHPDSGKFVVRPVRPECFSRCAFSLVGWEPQMRATLIALPCKASTATLTIQTSPGGFRHKSLAHGLHQLDGSHLSCVPPPRLWLGNDPAVASLAILVAVRRLVKQRLHN